MDHMDLVYKVVLQLKDLRVGQWEEPCIGLTQENSIENSVQDSLPYILYLGLMVCASYFYPTLNSHVYIIRPTCV